MNPLILFKKYMSQKNKALVFLLFFFVPVNQLAAQELCDLSYCIRTGLEQNFGLQVVRNQEEIALQNFTRGNAGMLPNINFSSQYGGTINNINQNLHDGSETNSNGLHNTHASASVNLGMTIFKGFQVKYTYQKLGMQTELGGFQTQMSVENLVSQIISEYNNFIQQLIQYKNLAYAVSLSRERVRIDEQRYLLGSASKLELLQSLVYLNSDSSRYTRQAEILQTAQIRLNELMAFENLDRHIVLKDTQININKELLYEELLLNTLDNNTSLQIARKNQDVSQLDYKIIESRSYPYLSVSSGYGHSFNAYEAATYRNQHANGFNYGLTLGMDIYNGSDRKREKSIARIKIENRNIECKEIEQQVKADLLTIFYAYKNNLSLLRLEEQNLEVARENLEIALERYKLGSLAGLELREVQKSLLDAEERLISVKFLTKLAEISLMQISGKIMDYV